MNSKTIVMIGNTSWGMLQFRADTIKELIHHKHKVIVLAPNDEYSSKLLALGCDYFSFKLDRKGTNFFSEISSVVSLVYQLRKLKPDIVINYTIKPAIYGTLSAKIAGCKKIIAVTTGLGFIFSHHNLTSKIAKLLYKLILKLANEVWFLNQDDKDVFIRQKLVSQNKSFVLPGEGVNTDFYKPAETKFSKQTFTLISRMLWEKGVGIYVESAKLLKMKYPEIDFLLVGPIDEGNPESISLKQIKNWHDQGTVQYLGAISDIRPILEKTSCLVHPTFYKEGLPRILLEACSMNIPCITTDIPGCRDVIQDGENGFLVKANSLESLTNSLERFILLKDSDKASLSINSRNKIKQKYCAIKINNIYFERLGLNQQGLN